MKLTLDRLLTSLETHARTILLHRKEPTLLTIYHLHSEDTQDLIVGTPWHNLREKQSALAEIKILARKHKASMIGTVAEAWMAEYQDKTPEDAMKLDPPSQQPHRIECVIAAVTDGKVTKGQTWKIIRDKPGGKITDLTKYMELLDGQMTGQMIEDLIP
jgi:hypothetical protein